MERLKGDSQHYSISFRLTPGREKEHLPQIVLSK